MKHQPHLYISEIPMHEHYTVQSLCGRMIENARTVCAWDSLLMGPLSLNSGYGCNTCWSELLLQSDGKRYVYAVTDEPLSEKEIRRELIAET